MSAARRSSQTRQEAARAHQAELEVQWRDSAERDEGWFDATVPYGVGIAPWPGDTAFSCGWTARTDDGASVNLSAFTTSPHVGTHADAPLHVRPGAASSESLPVLPFNGLVHVVDLRDLSGAISGELLRERLPVEAPMRIFLRTGASVSEGRFPESWPWLEAETTAACVAAGLRLLGTDAPSVDAREATRMPTHHACFDQGANVLENLDLRDVTPGSYELRALPMLVHGLDAAPMRVLLRSVA